MDVLEEGDRVVFLHRVVAGGADRPTVSMLPSLRDPRELTRRAREILTDLEQRPSGDGTKIRRRVMSSPMPDNLTIQLPFLLRRARW